MSVNTEELSKYVSSVIEGIEKGVKEGYHISKSIEFEIAVTHTKGAGGGLQIYVVKAEGKYDKQEISKIKFKVSPKKNRVAYLVSGP